MANLAYSELAHRSPTETIVHTSTLITHGFKHGIADVYEIARGKGFKTSGTYPSVALRYPERVRRSWFRGRMYCGWSDYITTS